MVSSETHDFVADLGNVTKAIVAFANSPEYRELDAFYRRKSNFEVLGIHRNETRHSRFLAWVLDPNGSHGLGTFGLLKFLEACIMARLESRQPDPKGVPPGLLDELAVGRVKVDKAIVSTEVALDKKSRIDIHVDCSLSGPGYPNKRLLILIENKVDSREHDAQTLKYAAWLCEHRSESDYALLIYLTPASTMKLIEYKEPDCECKDFLQINYQYIVDYLLEPALAMAQTGYGRDFIVDYLRALSVPSVIIEEEAENKGDLIMAISEHERNLLTAFWEQHRSLILAAFYAISDDPSQDAGLRDDADKVLRSLGGRDYSTYAVLLDGKVVSRNVKKTALGREVAKVLIESGITNEEFDLLKADRSSNFRLLKTKAEIPDSETKPNRYRVGREDPLTYNSVPYYVSGNWGDNNIPNFQRFLIQKFPRVQLEKEID